MLMVKSNSIVGFGTVSFGTLAEPQHIDKAPAKATIWWHNHRQGTAVVASPKIEAKRQAAQKTADIINAKGIEMTDLRSYPWAKRHGEKINSTHVIALLIKEEKRGSTLHREIANRLLAYYGNGQHDRITAAQEVAVIMFCSFGKEDR